MGAPGVDICIIDDEIVVCKRLQQYLSKAGHRVETFVDSQSAIERLDEKTFDVVVTDIRMDKIDGMEVLDHVLATRPGAKVILITGYATLEIAREAQAKGAYDFISKPFRPQDLQEVIDRAIQESDPHGQGKA
jgi:DNA-binding NtrC family response regulator